MTTEIPAEADETAYSVTLDREVCDGIFACLVRDERFVEAADGIAAIDPSTDDAVDTDESVAALDETVTATFTDERIEDARQAAAACPVDAISVEVLDDE